MRLQSLITAMEQIAPLQYAEAWDNVGLLVGDPEQEITGVMLCIDYTAAVAQEAESKKCNVIIAYHPSIFSPLKRITADNLIFTAIQRGIAIYSPHTALDSVPGGINDMLADILELSDRRPLRLAQGRIGTASPTISVKKIIDNIKQGLGIDAVLVSGMTKEKITRIACLAGAGGEFLDDAIAQNAQLYLTGEIRHHDALKAASANMTVICTLHSHSERIILKSLIKQLSKKLPELKLYLSHTDRDPFQIL